MASLLFTLVIEQQKNTQNKQCFVKTITLFLTNKTNTLMFSLSIDMSDTYSEL